MVFCFVAPSIWYFPPHVEWWSQLTFIYLGYAEASHIGMITKTLQLNQESYVDDHRQCYSIYIYTGIYDICRLLLRAYKLFFISRAHSSPKGLWPSKPFSVLTVTGQASLLRQHPNATLQAEVDVVTLDWYLQSQDFEVTTNRDGMWKVWRFQWIPVGRWVITVGTLGARAMERTAIKLFSSQRREKK